MKYFISILTALTVFVLGACSSDESTVVGKDGKVVTSKYTKKITMPLHPCEHISREMLVNLFDVEESELELNEDFLDPESYYAKCGYRWKKPNFEELEEKHRNAMMDYMMKGVSKKEGAKTSLSDVMKLESPYGSVSIGHFKQYDKMKSAVNQFTQLHRVPTKDDMAHLNKEIDKEFDEKKLDENSKKLGKELSGGIASNMKFTEIDGIGDQAFFDHLDKSLDVRFGTFSFKVYIDSSQDFDSNVEIAKKIAQEVWDKL
ncbi:MAG TPA: hypothetical protein VKY37_02995 [Brumimicrobium sp.]|nr:hypothetical protein [Brumimicrobium sp.]